MLCIPMVEREYGLKQGVAQNCAIVPRIASARCWSHFTPSHPRAPRQGQGCRKGIQSLVKLMSTLQAIEPGA